MKCGQCFVAVTLAILKTVSSQNLLYEAPVPRQPIYESDPGTYPIARKALKAPTLEKPLAAFLSILFPGMSGLYPGYMGSGGEMTSTPTPTTQRPELGAAELTTSFNINASMFEALLAGLQFYKSPIMNVVNIAEPCSGLKGAVPYGSLNTMNVHPFNQLSTIQPYPGFPPLGVQSVGHFGPQISGPVAPQISGPLAPQILGPVAPQMSGPVAPPFANHLQVPQISPVAPPFANHLQVPQISNYDPCLCKGPKDLDCPCPLHQNHPNQIMPIPPIPFRSSHPGQIPPTPQSHLGPLGHPYPSHVVQPQPRPLAPQQPHLIGPPYPNPVGPPHPIPMRPSPPIPVRPPHPIPIRPPHPNPVGPPHPIPIGHPPPHPLYPPHPTHLALPHPGPPISQNHGRTCSCPIPSRTRHFTLEKYIQDQPACNNLMAPEYTL